MAYKPRRSIVDSEKWAIQVMGRAGLFASTICKKLKAMGRGEFSPQQVYKVLKDSGISTLDYRQGCNEQAGQVFRSARLNSEQLPKPPRKTRKKRLTKRR